MGVTFETFDHELNCRGRDGDVRELCRDLFGSNFLVERDVVRQRHFYSVMSSIGFHLEIFMIVAGIRVEVRDNVGEKVMQIGSLLGSTIRLVM